MTVARGSRPILRSLGRPAWQRIGRWLRGIGLVLLLISFFAPIPSAPLLAILSAGLLLFLIGSLTWFAKDEEPWLRR